MANVKYNDDFNSPYKNNTLSGMLGNVKARVLNDQKKAGEEWQQEKETLANFGKNFLDFEKGVFIDKPLEAINATANFLTGEAEPNTPTAGRMPTASVIHVDMPNQSEQQTQQTTQGGQPTLQGTQPTTTTGGATSGGTQTNQGTNQTSTNTPTFSSVEDVVYYLAQQPGWNSLTEEQRVAMVDDLWSKQGAATGQTTQDTTSEQGNTKGSFGDGYAEDVTQKMQSDLQTDTTGDIYGKTTGSSSAGMTTNADVNSAFVTDAQARIARVNNVLTQDPLNIASAIAGGFNPYGEQVMRDVATYAPEFYNQIQTELKNIKAGKTINAIASGESLPDSGSSEIDSINNGMDMWAEAVGKTPQQTSYTIQNAQNALNNNMVASSATQEILNVNKEIERLNTKLNNIEKEANTVFKGDASQEIVNAFMNNRRQQYTQEIKELEGRRTAAFDLYKMEVENYKWGVEMANKDRQFNQDVENEMWDRQYKMQQLNKANIHWEDGKAYQVNSDGTITQLTDATALKSYQNDVASVINGYKARYTAGGGTKTATGYKYGYCGLECEGLSDNFTEMTTGLTMLPRDENGNIISGRTWTYAKEKISYINEEPGVVNIGDIAIAAGGVYDSTYGHTMIVTGRDPNTGIIELLWANKDGDKYVYSTTDTLSNLYAKGLRGFWNPYKDMVEAGATANGTYGYNDQGILITPMTEKFDTFIAEGVGAKSVAASEYIYDTLYKIIDDNSLATLINSGDFGKMWAYVGKSQFADTKDDEGITFWNALNDYKNKYMAKEFTGGEASTNALNALMKMVEKKLRKESGAVINSGEWRGEFELFLPRPGESADTQWDKLAGWDEYIISLLREGGLEKKTDYIPLFPKGQKREIF